MNRNITLALSLAIVFAATVLILSKILPGPHKPADYLVMGGVATVLCLAILFFVLIYTPGRGVGAPYKQKPSKSDRESI